MRMVLLEAHSFLTRYNSSFRLADNTSVTFFFESSLAIASPMPDEAPVIQMVLLFKFIKKK